ncbi:RluA family pseudouridine synthase [Patescibacteria group bacterium]|nr:RluA family pseudouridine synthase [Patescibacteria group bacterium]
MKSSLCQLTDRIIYEDGSILVIDKPPHLVVGPAESVKEKTLADILQKDFNINLFRGGIVHRLDKDTSGLILIAKTQAALENLQSQFKKRIVKKEYLALVHGFMEKQGKVEGAITRNPKNREKFMVEESGNGKEALTEYESMKRLQFTDDRLQEIFPDFNKIQMRKLERQRYREFTLILCKPKTGRTHQIRVHLKYINHPIVADEKYAGRKMVRLDKRWCPRVSLHAVRIGFRHPETNEWMKLESPLPEDLKKAIENLDL